jgi:hypothetical protein
MASQQLGLVWRPRARIACREDERHEKTAMQIYMQFVSRDDN